MDEPWLDPWCDHPIGASCVNCEVPWQPLCEPSTPMLRTGVPDRDANSFAQDADLTVYWPWVRPCWDAERRFPRCGYCGAHLAPGHVRPGYVVGYGMTFEACPGGQPLDMRSIFIGGIA